MSANYEWANVGAVEFIEAYNQVASKNGWYPKADSGTFVFKFKPEYVNKLDSLGFSKPRNVSEEPGCSLANWDQVPEYEIDKEGYVYLSFLFTYYRKEEAEEIIISYLDRSMLISMDELENV